MKYSMKDILSLSIKRSIESNEVYSKGDWEIVFELPDEKGKSIFRNYSVPAFYSAAGLSSVVLLAIGDIVNPGIHTHFCEMNADGTFKNKGNFPGPLVEYEDK